MSRPRDARTLTAESTSYLARRRAAMVHMLLVCLGVLTVNCLLGAGIVATERYVAARIRQQALARSYYQRGSESLNRQQWKEAKASLSEAQRLNSDDARTLNDLAWLLATCPDDQVRDGPLSERLAARACKMTNYENALYLDTLAAAHAEAGNFTQAIRRQQQACDTQNEGFEREFRERLELYRQGEPYRLAPRSDPPDPEDDDRQFAVFTVHLAFCIAAPHVAVLQL